MPSDAEREVLELRATHILEQRAKGVVVTLANMPGEEALRKLYKPQTVGLQKRRPWIDGTLADMYALIDTSGGTDACHPWRGKRRWNHPETTHFKRYEEGAFQLAEFVSKCPRRIMVWQVYGIVLETRWDVTPICADHLCCNVRHFAITPHGGGGRVRDRRSVPVAEWVGAHRA